MVTARATTWCSALSLSHTRTHARTHTKLIFRYNEPSGDYKANCFLFVGRPSTASGIQFNDQVRVRFRVRVRVRVRASVRASARVRVSARVTVKVRVRVTVSCSSVGLAGEG